MKPTNDDIIVVGIGGAAIGFVANVAEQVPGLRVLGFDSDMASGAAPGVAFTPLGSARCDGRGCGGDAIKARAAAIDNIAAVREAVAGVRLAAVAVSLGGGFGSGAAPEILKAMRDEGVTTICFATLPFAFEGSDRAATARRTLPLLEDSASAFTAIHLDSLFAASSADYLQEAYAAASATITDILSLFWRLAANPGFISLGAERIAALANSHAGAMRVAVAQAAGDGRASAAAHALLASRLPGPDARLDNAEAIVIGIIAGDDLRLSELSEISDSLASRIPATCHRDFGVIVDNSFANNIKLISLIFEKGIVEQAIPEEPTTPSVSSRRSSRKASGKRDLLSDSNSGTHFKGIDGTIYEGQNLDIPTYLRRNLPLDK